MCSIAHRGRGWEATWRVWLLAKECLPRTSITPDVNRLELRSDPRKRSCGDVVSTISCLERNFYLYVGKTTNADLMLLCRTTCAHRRIPSEHVLLKKMLCPSCSCFLVVITVVPTLISKSVAYLHRAAQSIYDFILEQRSRTRVWVAHRGLNHENSITTTRYWISARAYIGLTQACHVLRKEFGPLYYNSMRFSMDLHDLDRFLDTFKIVNRDKDNTPARLVTALHQVQPGDNGVEILALLHFLGWGSNVIKSRTRIAHHTKQHHTKQDWDFVDLASRIHHSWQPTHKSIATNHVMLHRRPVPTNSSSKAASCGTVIVIYVQETFK